MNIQQALSPFIENTDYAIASGQLVPLPKTRQVEQIIPHAEIPAIIGQEAHDIIPATFDVSGNELTPMIPAQEFIEAVAAVPAYDEVVLVDEEYFENIPSMDSVKLSCIEDVAIAVGEYLADKAELRDPENDSINIVNNNIFSWGFANIPQPSVDELFNAYNAAIAKNNQAQINAEALKYLADTDYKVFRHIRQKALQQSTTLSEEQYLQLEQTRSQKAESIIND